MTYYVIQEKRYGLWYNVGSVESKQEIEKILEDFKRLFPLDEFRTVKCNE